MQQVVALSKDIQEEARPSTQVEDIKDEVGAIFEACSKTTKDKADKVDKAKLLELLAKEVTRISLPVVLTIQEPIAAVPKLELKVINLPKELIFAAWRTSEPISGFSAGVKSINLVA